MILTHEQIITLQSVKGCGNTTINKIGKAVNEVRANSFSLRELYDYIGELISTKVVSRYKLPAYSEFDYANDEAKRIIEKSNRMGISIVSQFDADFPAPLLHTIGEDGKTSNPLLLYYKGNLSVTKLTNIAIIGTREPTREGILAGEFFGATLAKMGANIVSGLAIGCDSAGHRGALKAGGVTTAFLAHGLDSVYPPENESLADRIVFNGGLLMSEYEIGKTVNRYNLVARDRLQAGLSSSTIVIQTGVHGGTMHAVNATIASNKPLYAVKYDGRVFEKIDGNEFLIREKGAIPLTSTSDFHTFFSNSKTVATPTPVNDSVETGSLFNFDEL